MSADNLSQLKQDAEAAIAGASDLAALDDVRVAYLGKSGSISAQMKKVGGLPPEERKTFGAEVNALRNAVTEVLEARKLLLEKEALAQKLASEALDMSLPARPEVQGSIHPISHVIEEIEVIFAEMGFMAVAGPDVESDWNNFEALNFPANHPAREMQDTFFMEAADDEGKPYVLRTHTSSVQIRHMTEHGAPSRIICHGRTYRCDSDQTHSPMFHQVEGLVIEKRVHMGHLKWTLQSFLNRFFEQDDIPIRFRPSFFPFVEPGAEVDIGCTKGQGTLKIGAGDDWLEILGCGMVHPNVLKSCGIDPKEYQGFAFGIGIERLAMLKYGVSDLRTFFEGDVRWLEHYGFAPLGEAA